MISELVKSRRAVFPAQYNDRPISRETLEKILEAANWAPTHRRTEPWRFKVLLGEHKERFGDFLAQKYSEIESSPKNIKIKKYRENPRRSAAVILICMQRDLQERVPEWEEIAATAMAVQNMWLMCTDLGIGSYWSSPGLIQYMSEFVELAEGEKCLGIFYMGYYDGDIPAGVRSPVEEKLLWLG